MPGFGGADPKDVAARSKPSPSPASTPGQACTAAPATQTGALPPRACAARKPFPRNIFRQKIRKGTALAFLFSKYPRRRHPQSAMRAAIKGLARRAAASGPPLIDVADLIGPEPLQPLERGIDPFHPFRIDHSLFDQNLGVAGEKVIQHHAHPAALFRQPHPH
jgi:hypothetical protein